jgi:hypothetical protein
MKKISHVSDTAYGTITFLTNPYRKIIAIQIRSGIGRITAFFINKITTIKEFVVTIIGK